MTTNEIRWKQRLENYEKALTCLKDACHLTSYTQLEQAGLVQTFEFTFGLAWNVLKDLLFYEGIETKTPRASIRQGFTAGYLNEEDTETLLDALEKRHLLAHIYDETIAELAVQIIKDNYAPVLYRLYATLMEKKEQ